MVDRAGENSILVSPGANSTLRRPRPPPRAAVIADGDVLRLPAGDPGRHGDRRGRAPPAPAGTRVDPQRGTGARAAAGAAGRRGPAGRQRGRGADDHRRGARPDLAALLALVPRVVLTLGGDGAWYADRDGPRAHPGVPGRRATRRRPVTRSPARSRWPGARAATWWTRCAGLPRAACVRGRCHACPPPRSTIYRRSSVRRRRRAGRETRPAAACPVCARWAPIRPVALPSRRRASTSLYAPDDCRRLSPPVRRGPAAARGLGPPRPRAVQVGRIPVSTVESNCSDPSASLVTSWTSQWMLRPSAAAFARACSIASLEMSTPVTSQPRRAKVSRDRRCRDRGRAPCRPPPRRAVPGHRPLGRPATWRRALAHLAPGAKR